MLYLNIPLYYIIDLDIIECLDELLNLPSGLSRMLEVEPLNDVGHTSEPVRIVFVICVLSPVSVACKELGYLVDVFETFHLVLCPDRDLLLDQASE